MFTSPSKQLRDPAYRSRKSITAPLVSLIFGQAAGGRDAALTLEGEKVGSEGGCGAGGLGTGSLGLGLGLERDSSLSILSGNFR